MIGAAMTVDTIGAAMTVEMIGAAMIGAAIAVVATVETAEVAYIFD